LRLRVADNIEARSLGRKQDYVSDTPWQCY